MSQHRDDSRTGGMLGIAPDRLSVSVDHEPSEVSEPTTDPVPRAVTDSVPSTANDAAGNDATAKSATTGPAVNSAIGVGTVLNRRYRLTGLIGRGGMADVYRADDEVLRRPVAVKVFRPGTDRNADRLRFLAEIRTLASLAHPNLVALYDGGQDEAHPWCVMQTMEGGTLADLEGADNGTADPARVATIGAQIADGLAYIHDRGIVHRDVKPSNVLLDSDGDAYLSDFGVAQMVDATRMTATGALLGTAAYLSPEQVLGRHATAAVDVYALALVLLETLTGTREFPGAPIESAVARLSRAPRVPNRLGPAWAELLTAMTAIEPEDRPDAAAAASWLHSLARGTREEGAVPLQRTRTTPDTAPTGISPAAFRPPAATGTISTVGLRAVPEADDAPPGTWPEKATRLIRSTRARTAGMAAGAVVVVLLGAWQLPAVFAGRGPAVPVGSSDVTASTDGGALNDQGLDAPSLGSPLPSRASGGAAGGFRPDLTNGGKVGIRTTAPRRVTTASTSVPSVKASAKPSTGPTTAPSSPSVVSSVPGPSTDPTTPTSTDPTTTTTTTTTTSTTSTTTSTTTTSSPPPGPA